MSNSSKIIQLPDNQRASAYLSLCEEYITTENTDGMIQLIQDLVAQELSNIYGRSNIIQPVLLQFMNNIRDEEGRYESNFALDDVPGLCQEIITSLSSCKDEFINVIYYATDLSALSYEALEEPRQSIECRSSINVVDSATLTVPLADRLGWVTHHASLYLSPLLDSANSAMSVMKSSDSLVQGYKSELGSRNQFIDQTLVDYTLAYGQVLLQNSFYNEAALQYLSLLDYATTHMNTQEVVAKAGEDAVGMLLLHCFRCFLITTTSPAKQRTSINLVSQLRQFESVVVVKADGLTLNASFLLDVVDKLTSGLTVKKNYVSTLLKPAVMGDYILSIISPVGKTIVETALMEHNLVACSHIYTNMTLNHLSHYLACTVEQAEESVAKMIASKKLQGRIDQEKDVVWFEMGDNTMKEWNAKINSLCAHIITTTDAILNIKNAI